MQAILPLTRNAVVQPREPRRGTKTVFEIPMKMPLRCS